MVASVVLADGRSGCDSVQEDATLYKRMRLKEGGKRGFHWKFYETDFPS